MEKTIRFEVTRIRRREGMTQAELCRAIGISQSHLSKIETGEILPNLELAFRIADRLGYTIDEMIRCQDVTAEKLRMMRNVEHMNKMRIAAWEEQHGKPEDSD